MTDELEPCLEFTCSHEHVAVTAAQLVESGVPPLRLLGEIVFQCKKGCTVKGQRMMLAPTHPLLQGMEAKMADKDEPWISNLN